EATAFSNDDAAIDWTAGWHSCTVGVATETGIAMGTVELPEVACLIDSRFCTTSPVADGRRAGTLCSSLAIKSAQSGGRSGLMDRTGSGCCVANAVRS